jgi:hypothetical protein
MSDDNWFTVDLEFKHGGSRSIQFVTQQEAVAYAGRMAMDVGIARSEVKGIALDARPLDTRAPGSGPIEDLTNTKYGQGKPPPKPKPSTDAEEHSLQISLKAKDGKRLTVSMRTSGPRSTAQENGIRKQVENQVNADPEHKKYGPWEATGSSWQR